MKNPLLINSIFPSSGDTLFLRDAEEKISSLVFDLKNAQNEILIQYFMIEHGLFFNKILVELKRALTRGVKIYIIYDAVGTKRSKRTAVKILKDIGCKVERFNVKRRFLRLPYFNHRDHRKTFIIDGKHSHIGGINIADKYLDRKSWIDFHTFISGNAPNVLRSTFVKTWNYLSDEKIHCGYPTPKFYTGENSVKVVTSSPGEGFGDSYWSKMNLITLAQEKIQIVSPYIFINKSMKNLLINKINNGVQVEIITSEKSDSKIVTWAMRYQLKVLQKIGCKIHFVKNAFVHAKLMLIDGKIANVGSSNMDMRSFKINFEQDLNIVNQKYIGECKRFINRIAQNNISEKIKFNVLQKLLFHILKNQL